ncbi:MAG: pantoate--beta-alanine ligase [Bacteroidetes bacterium]|nr:pantoate--beta-alanine ligase [Bacteroidota bacterium]
MEIIKSTAEAQHLADTIRNSGRLIGLVPTMGALHKGHLALIDAVSEQVDVTILTIFVNPTQFGPNEDFNRYPRQLEADIQLAESVDADYLFCPEVSDMYPGGELTQVQVSGLPDHLCGLSRPGHFTGVTTVVAKLFNILKPHVAIFGEKDMQQAIIIKKMVRDLNFDVRILTLPIVREADGLAMSSRNQYLSHEDRIQAVKLFQSLNFAKEMVLTGEKHVEVIREAMTRFITGGTSAVIDYVSFADPDTLDDLSELPAGSQVLIALAVKFGSTRLIDNLMVKVPQFQD